MSVGRTQQTQTTSRTGRSPVAHAGLVRHLLRSVAGYSASVSTLDLFRSHLSGLTALFLLSLTSLGLTGCNSENAASTATTTTEKHPSGVLPGKEQTPKLRPPTPVFDKWDKPNLLLVLSGEQRGYLEPCGCSATQSGGFSRRANFFQQIADKKWPVLALDLGELLLRDREQDRLKLEAILKGMRQMKYGAVGIGRSELRIGPSTLLQLYQPDQPDSLPFVSSNIVFFDTPDLGTPTPFKTLTVDGIKVTVTGILGKKYWSEMISPNKPPEGVKVEDPEVALTKLLPKLKETKSDLLVLLSHASVPESKALAEKFPDFQIVLTAGGAEDGDAKPTPVGKSWLVAVGAKGKHLGGIGFYKQNAEQPLRYELVDLDNQRFQETESMRELMRGYQEQIKGNDLVAQMIPVQHTRDSKFMGAKHCAECHTKSYAKWMNSKHSHAFESLEKGRKGLEATWVSRVHDPECLACHVTGWDPQNILRFTSGYESRTKTPHLMGQQCENCHGPGSKHVEVETALRANHRMNDQVLAMRKEMHLDTAVAKSRVCIQCHDPDNSPKYNFEEYWKQVDHKGMRD